MMNPGEIKEIVNSQRRLFASNATRDVRFRIKMLKKLKKALVLNKEDIVNSVEDDFGVSGPYDAYGRVVFILDEINYFIRNLKKWTKPVKVKTSLLVQPAKSYYQYEPLGTVLLIAAWNAPYMVNFLTLIASIAAGNCTIIKPSELSPATSAIIKKIIASVFDDSFCAVVEGGVEETTALLKEKIDLICYTGSSRVGKIIYQKASERLVPVILELGGKSPCIVDDSANVKLSAKRICSAKHLNAGQVCTAPDYLLVHSSIKDKFINEMIKNFNNFYPNGARASNDYMSIINERHFDRLVRLIKSVNPSNIVYGGKTDKSKLKIEPTIVDHARWDDEIMKEEIFGPLIPVVEYESLDGIKEKIAQREKPLALYIYSKNKANIKKIQNETTSGGMGINVSILHYMNKYLPFGGVGNSGFGRYRGKSGLESFSNKKGIMNKALWFESNLLDPPYGNKHKILNFFIR